MLHPAMPPFCCTATLLLLLPSCADLTACTVLTCSHCNNTFQVRCCSSALLPVPLSPTLVQPFDSRPLPSLIRLNYRPAMSSTRHHTKQHNKQTTLTSDSSAFDDATAGNTHTHTHQVSHSRPELYMRSTRCSLTPSPSWYVVLSCRVRCC